MTDSDDSSPHRRDLLKLTAGLAAFGAAMGLSRDPAAAKDISLNFSEIKGGSRLRTQKHKDSKAPAKYREEFLKKTDSRGKSRR